MKKIVSLLGVLALIGCEEMQHRDGALSPEEIEQAEIGVSDCVRYVDEELEENGDGLSWKTAFNDLDATLELSDKESGIGRMCEVWVKGEAGEERLAPYQDALADSGVEYFDGFEGGETQRTQANHSPAVLGYEDSRRPAAQGAEQPLIETGFAQVSERALDWTGPVVPDRNALSIGTFWKHYTIGGITWGVTPRYDAHIVFAPSGLLAKGKENDGSGAPLVVQTTSTAPMMYIDGDEIDSTGTLVLNKNSKNTVAIAPDGGNVGVGCSTPYSKLDVRGSIRGNRNTNTASYFGRAAVGYCGHSDYAAFSHLDSNSRTGYALLQHSSGETYLNAGPGKNINFRIGNGTKMRLDSSGRIAVGHGNGTTSSTFAIKGYDNDGSRAALRLVSGHQTMLLGGNEIDTLSTPLFFNHNSKQDTIFNRNGGNVAIGTANPSYKLEVNGGIRAKEIVIESSDWADFVFEYDYNLMELSDVERFIDENGHLPDIPSAAEVEKSGVSLAETQARLLQKIEELMLYTIEQDKKIKRIQAMID